MSRSRFARYRIAAAMLLAACLDASAGDYMFAPLGNSTRTDRPENWVPYGGPMGSNDRVISIADAGGSGERTATAAQIPEGFELVWITDDPEDDSKWANINNCGEIVFTTGGAGAARQIMLYDNGLFRQLTFDDPVRNEFPDINNNGVVVWQHDWDELSLGDMVVWNKGDISVAGHGLGPVINDAGQMSWQNRYDEGCFGGDADVFLYDDGDTLQLTADFLSNQATQMNALGEVVWTHYDFCAVPWEATPAYYDGNQVQLLPTAQIKAIAPDITNTGIIAWGGDGGIEVWEKGTTTLLTEWGAGARLNERGDIAILRWHDENSTWQVWLYSNNQFYQITDGPVWHAWLEINDHGEVVLTNGQVNERLLRLMRRIRNGDVDFDGKVSAADYSTFPGCATGPFKIDRLCDCRFFDIDHDRDVDLRDYARFANGFGKL